ncbi:Phosphatidylinositol N-acetylglucosaminyltransferase subunit P [Schistosoma japonicum]|nr:Phosphatidylinositol N-acetylglucosaminyltransferase subunit P [Schistosoma japonicum]
MLCRSVAESSASSSKFDLYWVFIGYILILYILLTALRICTEVRYFANFRHWAVTAPILSLIICISGLLSYTWNNRSLMQPLTSIYQIRDSYSMYHGNSTDRSYDDQQLNSVDLSKPINSLKQMPIIPPLCDLDYTWVTKELYLKKINIK